MPGGDNNKILSLWASAFISDFACLRVMVSISKYSLTGVIQ
jgi:hypothetical protein